MKKYQIAGIIFKIHHCYDEFLKDNIESYETSTGQTEHTLEVFLSDHIKHPIGETKSTKNPYVIFKENNIIIYIKNKDNQIKSCIEHDNAYNYVKITINPKLTKNAAEIEYTWLGLMFMEIALKHRLLPFHAAAIDNHGKAILILAPSQTGKSTHARFWSEMDHEVEIMNDDKPLVGVENNQLMVYSSPFSGKTSINQNKAIPLSSLIFLYQSNKDEIITLSKDEMIKEMLKNMMRPLDEKSWSDITHIMNLIIDRIPIYRLNATLNISSAKLLKKTLEEGV